MDIKTALNHLVNREDLNSSTMRAVMETIMQGKATQAQIGAVLVALRMKGETVTEIVAAANVMRELATKVPVDDTRLVDTCGTGGDGCNTFNISTASAFVAAAAGARVAKHGNRAVSSSSGSADVLEAAGVNLALTPAQVAKCIEKIGVGFLFAPMHHGAMKHAVGPRKELGLRTLFNLLGPLSNPAGARNQVLGVFDRAWLEPLAKVLHELGSRHVMVVHADDGLDEISLCTSTEVTELRDGHVRSYRIRPEDYDLQCCQPEALQADGVNASLQMIHGALDGSIPAARDIVALNAGAAIYVADCSTDLSAGIHKALAVINDGSARARLDELIKFTQQYATS